MSDHWIKIKENNKSHVKIYESWENQEEVTSVNQEVGYKAIFKPVNKNERFFFSS